MKSVSKVNCILFIIIIFFFLNDYYFFRRVKHSKDNVRLAHRDDFLIENAIAIHNEYSVVQLQLLNEGYLEMTKSWICNVRNYKNVLERTLFVTTDLKSYNGLLDFNKDLNVQLKEYSTPKSMTYGKYDYYDYMLFRTNLIVSLLNKNIRVFLVESDAVWMSDPTDIIFSSPRADIVTMSDMAPPVKSLQGGFQLLTPTRMTKYVWNELLVEFNKIMIHVKSEHVTDLGNLGSEQLMLDRIIRRTPALVVSWLPADKFIPGLYYKNKNIQLRSEPIVILNNWIIGNNQKINRAKKWKHWYLSDNNKTCI